MKNLTLLLALCFSMPIFSQDTTDVELSKSNADLFIASSGRLLYKTHYFMGSVHKVDVEAVKATDLLTKDTVRFVRIESAFALRYTTVKKVVSLDLDELHNLIKSMLLLEQSIFLQQPSHYTEAVFLSRSSFATGAFYEFKSKTWKPFVRLSYNDDYTVFLSIQEFQTFRLLLEDSLNRLVKIN